jgi:neurotransmitter:Na+ symporter, NSS family
VFERAQGLVSVGSHRQILFLMISLGSSFSLGNLWRFPFVVSENGGGSFVFLYIFLGFLVGLPVLTLEMFLSSEFQKNQSQKVFRVIPMILSFFVLTYYSVISGWVLFFLTDFLMLMLNTQRQPQGLYVLFRWPWLQWLLASVHIILFVFLWMRQKESLLWRFRLVILPLIVFTLGLLLYQSLQLTSIADSLRYLFYPDFEKWSRYSIGHAIGHVFFTLSVGFGVFLMIREFYDSKDHSPTIALKMTIMDILFSLISLMVVFPIIFLQRHKTHSNPFLLFDFLPPSFLNFKYGLLFGFLFFLLLYLSALNSSLILFRSLIGLIKPIWQARIAKTAPVETHKVGIGAGMALFIFCSFPALGVPFYFFMKVNNFNLIEKMDHILIHWLLPIGVLCMLLTTRKQIRSIEFRNFIVQQGSATSEWFYEPLKIILLYFIPFLILTDLVSRIF